MKNRRNTRRGRAKRWTRRWGTDRRTRWCLRGTDVFVMSAPIFCGEWGTFDMGADIGQSPTIYAPSRAAAMRAAEHLARQR